MKKLLLLFAILLVSVVRGQDFEFDCGPIPCNDIEITGTVKNHFGGTWYFVYNNVVDLNTFPNKNKGDTYEFLYDGEVYTFTVGLHVTSGGQDFTHPYIRFSSPLLSQVPGGELVVCHDKIIPAVDEFVTLGEDTGLADWDETEYLRVNSDGVTAAFGVNGSQIIYLKPGFKKYIDDLGKEIEYFVYKDIRYDVRYTALYDDAGGFRYEIASEKVDDRYLRWRGDDLDDEFVYITFKDFAYHSTPKYFEGGLVHVEGHSGFTYPQPEPWRVIYIPHIDTWVTLHNRWSDVTGSGYGAYNEWKSLPNPNTDGASSGQGYLNGLITFGQYNYFQTFQQSLYYIIGRELTLQEKLDECVIDTVESTSYNIMVGGSLVTGRRVRFSATVEYNLPAEGTAFYIKDVSNGGKPLEVISGRQNGVPLLYRADLISLSGTGNSWEHEIEIYNCN